MRSIKSSPIRKAIKGSIKHWEYNLANLEIGNESDDMYSWRKCPLCVMWDVNCTAYINGSRCPLFEHGNCCTDTFSFYRIAAAQDTDLNIKIRAAKELLKVLNNILEDPQYAE